ncbi:S8 family peptidase [Kaarinaea lacus]
MTYGLTHARKTVTRCIFLFVVGALLAACDVSKEDNTPPVIDTGGNDTGGTNTGGNNNVVTLSGSISIASGSGIDSDVNDPNAPYQSNDSLADAQTISNPTTLGGYVNLPGFGRSGRSFASGDSDDYYIVHLFANQSVTITTADFDSATNRVSLFLLDENGDVVSHTTGDRQTDVVNVNADGIYYLRVFALAGASGYVLTLGLSGQQQSIASSKMTVDQDFVPGEVIVEYKQGSSNLLQPNAARINAATIASTLGLQYKSGHVSRNLLLKLGSGSNLNQSFSALGIQRKIQSNDSTQQLKLDTIAIVKALRMRPDVVSARLNYIRKPFRVPNDEYYSYQWHYPQIDLPQAWDITTGSSNVIVAVIDTGVLSNHPDLQGQLVPGYDFIQDPDNAADGDGIDDDPFDVGDDANGNSSFHGTHVSGTIAAASDNSNGVAGVTWGARVMPLRTLGRFGGTDYDIEQAVRFAAQLPNDSGTIPDQKADVINLSLGGPTNSTVPTEAFRLAREAGVIVVAASGNEASSGLNYPASLDGVVSVSATTIRDALAPYSNFGDTIDIAAPGGNFSDVNGDGYADGILSTVGSDANGPIQLGYAFYQGTSMASPHIAGVVALMKSVNPDLSPDEFDQLLENGELTDDLGALGRDNQFGYGLVNAYKAVIAARNLVDVPVELRPPLAAVQPTALNFGAAGVSMDLNISNAGDGVLEVLQINNDSNGWLSVTELSVDANGLGRYLVQVNRQSLPAQTQTYSATITVTTSVNVVNIPVLMQVFVENVEDNAGFHYAVLSDSVSQATIQKVAAQLVNGEYHFSFNNVGPGSYTISAGTDSDNDGRICEVAEACGTYLIPDYIVPIVVDNESGNRGGIDFETSFDNVINVGSAQLPMIKLNQALY